MDSVLYIDNDEDDREIFSDIARDRFPGLNIVLAKDGPDGLEYLKNLNADLPCLIILDWNMPGWNGLEAFRNIRAVPELAPIPVAFLSTNPRVKEQDYLKLQPGVRLFGKSVNLQELRATVTEILKDLR